MRKLLYILLCLPLFANGQVLINSYRFAGGGGSPTPTRFYLSSTNSTVGISPTQDAGWDVTGGLDRRLMSTTKDASAATSKSSGGSGLSAAGNRDLIIRQYVSPAIAAQTISGTVSIQVRGNMSSTSSRTGKMTVIIRVIASDGTTVRGTLYSTLGAGVGSDYSTTLTNRSVAGASLSSVSASAGDYIVVELGWTYTSGSGNTTGTMSFGSDSGTDLPVNETETNAYNAWIEFSNGIIF